jgi:hypothetical protein
MLGRQYFDLMPQRQQRSCPVMGTGTSLHRNKASLALGKEIGELGTLDLASLNFTRIHINDMKLKYGFG